MFGVSNSSAYFIPVAERPLVNPYISQLSPIFEEGVKGGYFIKRTDGSPWQWDLWQPGLAVLDVTNPEACQWYTKKLSALLDIGVDTFKVYFFPFPRTHR